MFDFEREFDAIEDKVTLHPPIQKRNFWFRWIKTNWEYGYYLSALLPFFLLSLLSFLLVVESQFTFFFPTAIILGALALVVAVLFR